MKKGLLKQSRHLFAPLLVVGAFCAVILSHDNTTALETVLERGELVVVSRVSPSTWYQDQHGDTGLEYELAKEFADYLGVNLRMIAAQNFAELQQLVEHNQADIAAAALAITPERKQTLQFTSAYQSIDNLLIYRLGEQRPRQLENLVDKKIAVLANSGQHATIEQLQADGLNISWEAIDSVNMEKLLTLVDEGYVDYALVNSNAFHIHRGLYPELATAMTLGQQYLAWATGIEQDQTLVQAAQRFLTQRKANGFIARLEDRFYRHDESFNIYAARKFMSHLDSRLPQYLEWFQSAAADEDLDWRLVAAMGYQESLWDPEAVSPTGVRGIMMLTNNTAEEMGIADRTDPEQSIRAGAAYFRKIYDRIPDRIAQADRTWMAIAAYNVGLGHLFDARILTKKQGADPDKWEDVRSRLPLLRKAEFYSDTRHGYARGGMQSVIYVRHVQRYYDLMVWAAESPHHGPQIVAMLNQ